MKRLRRRSWSAWAAWVPYVALLASTTILAVTAFDAWVWPWPLFLAATLFLSTSRAASAYRFGYLRGTHDALLTLADASARPEEVSPEAYVQAALDRAGEAHPPAWCRHPWERGPAGW